MVEGGREGQIEVEGEIIVSTWHGGYAVPAEGNDLCCESELWPVSTLVRCVSVSRDVWSGHDIQHSLITQRTSHH